MKRITKKRIAEQRAAIGIALEVPLPDDIAKHLLDLREMLIDLDSLLEPEDKFKAAADLMVSVGLITAKKAKQHLAVADQYRGIDDSDKE